MPPVRNKRVDQKLERKVELAWKKARALRMQELRWLRVSERPFINQWGLGCGDSRYAGFSSYLEVPKGTRDFIERAWEVAWEARTCH